MMTFLVSTITSPWKWNIIQMSFLMPFTLWLCVYVSWGWKQQNRLFIISALFLNPVIHWFTDSVWPYQIYIGVFVTWLPLVGSIGAEYTEYVMWSISCTHYRLIHYVHLTYMILLVAPITCSFLLNTWKELVCIMGHLWQFIFISMMAWSIAVDNVSLLQLGSLGSTLCGMCLGSLGTVPYGWFGM